jgi:hypothetical protein
MEVLMLSLTFEIQRIVDPLSVKRTGSKLFEVEDVKPVFIQEVIKDEIRFSIHPGP